MQRSALAVETKSKDEGELMANIQDFIQSAVGSLGVSEGTAQSGVGAILQALQGNADAGDFQQLLSAMPGSEALLSKAGSSAGAGESGGGGLGGALGAVGSMLGGGSGSALGVLSMLQGSGLSADKLGPFVSKFIDFAKSSAGQALIGRVLSKVPEIAKFVS
jgi:hypothetical protein